MVTVGDTAIIGAYFPQGEAKRPYWRAIADAARQRSGEPTLIIGDFNTGRHFIDEARKTFAVAEAMDWMAEAGFIDLWRSRNPDTPDFSWESNVGNRFRLDHAFASPPLAVGVLDVRYSHQERIDGISDHSALIVDIVTASA